MNESKVIMDLVTAKLRELRGDETLSVTRLSYDCTGAHHTGDFSDREIRFLNKKAVQ